MTAIASDDDHGPPTSDEDSFGPDELVWTGRRRRWWQGGLLLGALGLATIVYFRALHPQATGATTPVRTVQLEPVRAPLICPQPDPTPVLAVRREVPGSRRARHGGAHARRAMPARR